MQHLLLVVVANATFALDLAKKRRLLDRRWMKKIAVRIEYEAGKAQELIDRRADMEEMWWSCCWKLEGLSWKEDEKRKEMRDGDDQREKTPFLGVPVVVELALGSVRVGKKMRPGWRRKHVETGADITISCIPVDASRASDYGLVRVDKNGRITEFQEKPRGDDLEAMKDDGSFLRLSHQDTKKYPYIASMGIYVFNRKALQRQFMMRDGRANDFGQHILPFAVNYFNVQAYMFQDYWEDIGTLKAFYKANLALTEQSPKFQFYDQRTPMYTSPRYLPPTKIDKSMMRSSIISHGCFLYNCDIERSIIGVGSRISAGAEIKNTLMFGANTYETDEQIASLLEKGMVPIGVGQNTKIRNCIIDTNARIGQNVVIANKDGVEEADRSSEGFYIRSGITIILRNATIKDGTVI
ncbi:hypothetical protein ZIOFF_022766 [Zingiber officinale]|uniref:glucose-1-phosphate adenylyltransferase n=1 Tax=Zingiber officinale TaxID=94328 RepID=A0A8J5LKD8_ZINOF|nr:hypothetical protein ZIOFF_022766 [Zingiber officinale]